MIQDTICLFRDLCYLIYQLYSFDQLHSENLISLKQISIYPPFPLHFLLSVHYLDHHSTSSWPQPQIHFEKCYFLKHLLIPLIIFIFLKLNPYSWVDEDQMLNSNAFELNFSFWLYFIPIHLFVEIFWKYLFSNGLKISVMRESPLVFSLL